MFPPPLGPFCQINYLFELSSGYPSYPITQFKSEFDFFKLAVVEDVQLLDVLANLVKQGQ